MTPSNRASFVSAYSNLVTTVWTDPRAEHRLHEDAAGLLAEFGLDLPANVALHIDRDTEAQQPDLDAQVRAWEQAETTGIVRLAVPPVPELDRQELNEDELIGVVGGIDTGCACCCPCCCS